MATTSTTQAPPKKTMFKTLFKGGGGGAGGKSKSPTSYPHPTTSSQSTKQGTIEIHNAGCTCCKKKFTLRQSFRKSTCHGCHKKVCKKCYLVNKLCHKCVVKQRPEVNSTAELLKIDSDRLVAILNQVHCDSTLIETSKNDQNAMVRTLLNICELKSTLIEYEKTISGKNVTLRHDKTAPQKSKVSTKQPDNLPPNSTFIDMHRISMPPQNEGDAEFTVISKQLELSTSQEQSTGTVQVAITNGHQHHQTVEQSLEEESLIFQSPNMKNSPHFVAFLPDHVIEEEDENEKEEVEHGTFEYPRDPVFITPPLTPNSNRKSQIEIFHSAAEIPQMEENNEKSLDDQTKESLGFVKLITGEENFLIENQEEQVEVDAKNEVANEILRLDMQMKEEHNEIGENNFELKLNSLNQAYRSQYKVKLGDLATTPSERDIGQFTLFELKTILQKRGKPITGLITYEDFVQKVTSVLEEEKSAKEVERKAREEEEEKCRQELLERRLEEEMRKMEDERQCLEEAERFKKLYEEEHGLRENDAEEEESDDEEQQLSDDEVEMEFERAEVIQAKVKTAKMMKTEVDDMDQIEFEMIENRLQIEEIEEEWKTSAITYNEIAPPSQPEMVKLDDEDSLTSLPSAPSPPPIT